LPSPDRQMFRLTWQRFGVTSRVLSGQKLRREPCWKLPLLLVLTNTVGSAITHTTPPTSEFDDIVNGIDGVVEFQDRPDSLSLLGLAIDITEDSEEISRKLGSLQQGIAKGETGKLKYFQPQHSSLSVKGGWKNIPKFLAVSGRQTMERLARNWYEENPAMANEPLQMNILMQLRLQAQVYANYARRLNNKSLADMYVAVDQRLKGIMSQKSELLQKSASPAEFRKEPNALLMLRKMTEMGFDINGVQL
jgi:hypothetical protein